MRTYDPHAAAALFGTDGWFKATASDDNGTGCVEVNFGAGGMVGLRDSKDPNGPAFVFTSAEWSRFLGRVETAHADV